LAIGGKGVISVTANVLPDKVSELCRAATAGDGDLARTLHYELMAINDALFIETNPVPVKTALALMGKIEDELRSPLAPLAPDNLEKLKAILRKYSLIS